MISFSSWIVISFLCVLRSNVGIWRSLSFSLLYFISYRCNSLAQNSTVIISWSTRTYLGLFLFPRVALFDFHVDIFFFISSSYLNNESNYLPLCRSYHSFVLSCQKLCFTRIKFSKKISVDTFLCKIIMMLLLSMFLKIITIDRMKLTIILKKSIWNKFWNIIFVSNTNHFSWWFS